VGRPLFRRLAAIAMLLAVSPWSSAWAGTAAAEAPRPISRENPVYPQGALVQGVEGSVLVEFTVDEHGRVVAPRVLEATPPGVFDRATLRALSRWKYEAQDAEAKVMKVRMTFRK
jgi:protein TonB